FFALHIRMSITARACESLCGEPVKKQECPECASTEAAVTFTFDAGMSNQAAIVDASVQMEITAIAIINVASVRHWLNNTEVQVSFTINPGDTYVAAITRTVASDPATLVLSADGIVNGISVDAPQAEFIQPDPALVFGTEMVTSPGRAYRDPFSQFVVKDDPGDFAFRNAYYSRQIFSGDGSLTSGRLHHVNYEIGISDVQKTPVGPGGFSNANQWRSRMDYSLGFLIGNRFYAYENGVFLQSMWGPQNSTFHRMQLVSEGGYVHAEYNTNRYGPQAWTRWFTFPTPIFTRQFRASLLDADRADQSVYASPQLGGGWRS
ncbi:MAG: hypothetical protein AAF570_25565, partial [Bacteroidota bacterium]